MALAKSLIVTTEFRGVPTEYNGKKYESCALVKYQSVTGNQVDLSGILECSEVPNLAASPNGTVRSDGIVEVKCPFTAKDEHITITSVPNLCKDDPGIFMLKRDHCYFYKVQGILLCSDRSWCDLSSGHSGILRSYVPLKMMSLYVKCKEN